MKRDRIFCAWLVAVSLCASSTPAAATTLSAVLDGRAVPSGGDPDGKARFSLSIDQLSGRLCYRLDIRDVDHHAVARIRRIARAKEGAPVLDLRIGVNSCASPGTALARDIVANPGAFYIDVLSTGFPTGVVRGQLALAY